MSKVNEGLEKLKQLSTSPFEPEPPQKILAVNAFMALARRANKAVNSTPHLFGGSNLSKVEWEFKTGDSLFESIQDYLSIDMDNKHVLDVGCGWGGKMIYLAKNTKLASISGFDLPGVYEPEASFKYARQQNVSNCFFSTGFAERIPYEADKFDVLIMEDVLEHVVDPERVISECYRVTKPGGLIIVKFPSFKMMNAHHLDRALSLPALHYILPMKKWAAGLNYLLLEPEHRLSYEPFDEVVPTKFNNSITRNLNGLDFAGFSEIIRSSRFEIINMQYVRYQTNQNGRKKLLKRAYNLIYDLGILSEFLSSHILFIGRK